MRPQPPAEFCYLRVVLERHLLRMRRREENDAGLATLEYIVLAAFLVVAAVAVATFLVGKIKSYQGKIK